MRSKQRQIRPRDVRLLAGWSQSKLAVFAHCSASTVRIFEIDPSSVADPAKRRRLRETYVNLAALVL